VVLNEPEILEVMLRSLTTWAGEWGDLASVADLFLSIFGFALTIFGVWRSKKSAQRAEEAVERMRKVILRSDTIADFSAVLTVMEEIKRLHRVNAWHLLPDRYSLLRRKLVTIRTANAGFSEEHQTALQSAVQHFTSIEQRVERSLASNTAPPNAAKLNQIVSAQIDRLEEVLTTLKANIGVEHGRQAHSPTPAPPRADNGGKREVGRDRG
jgi:hypothetical protein